MTTIAGTAWTSTTQPQFKISLTLGYIEFILTKQEWENIASVANQALALFAQPLSPEVTLALLTNVLTIDP